jgi:hypothetical protein
MATSKRLFRAGQVVVASIDNGQWKKVMVGEPDKHGWVGAPVIVATTPGGIDALIEALKDARVELWKT